jgi:hypothetical protein
VPEPPIRRRHPTQAQEIPSCDSLLNQWINLPGLQPPAIVSSPDCLIGGGAGRERNFRRPFPFLLNLNDR